MRPVRESAVEYSLIGLDKKLFIIQPQGHSKAGPVARRLKVRKRARARKKALSTVIATLLIVIMTATVSITSSTTTYVANTYTGQTVSNTYASSTTASKQTSTRTTLPPPSRPVPTYTSSTTTSMKTTGTSSIFTKTTSTSQMTSTSPVQAGYTIFIDSDGKIKARNTVTGIIDYQSTDAAAMLQRAIDTLSSTGGSIILRSGTYVWESVPALPKSLPKWLKIVGDSGVIIKLTEKGPRAFDFRKIADYDTFQNIWLEGFTVDCNNVGGRHHVVLGAYISGVHQSRINMQDITICNIKTINVPVDPTITNYRLNVDLATTHLAAGETRTNIQRILIEDCDFHGGNYGVGIYGQIGPVQTGLNVFIDDIHINRCRHTLGSVQTSQFDSANFHVGSLGFGGSCYISNCFGQYSGDVGIEVNGFTTAVVENCMIEDAVGAAYYHTNYNNPLKANEQTITMRDCVARKIAVSGTVDSHGFECVDNLSVPLGAVTVENCTFYSAVRDYAPNNVPGEALRAFSKSGFRSFTTRGFKATYDSISYAASGNKWFRPVSLYVPSGTFNTSLKDVEIVVRGTKQAASGSLGMTAVGVDGNDVHMTFDNIVVDCSIANIDAGNMYGIDIGYEKSTVEGTIRGFRVRQMATYREPRGIIVEGTKTLTIDKQIVIENCDFSAMPANGVEVLFTGGNQDKTYLYGNVWIPKSQ